jgi:GPH family glycoside/pentoside/hexuronide:cation symporter
MKDGKKPEQKPAKDKVGLLHQAGWSSRAVSLSINVVLLMQITYFCTNVLGMSPMLTGSILLATKIFDGFTDLVAGVLITKIRSRFGVVRHYEWCIVPLWIFTVLLFSTPLGLSMTSKAIWIFVFYSLVNAVCSTLLNSSDAIYLARSLPNQQVRAKMLTVNGLIVMLFSMIASTQLPRMMNTIGTTEGGWTKIALIFGVPATIIGLGRFFLVKEVEDAKTAEPLKIGEGLRVLGKNKYIFLVAISSLLIMFVTGINGTMGSYYFQYIVGNLSLLGVMGILGVVALLFMPLFPVLLRKTGAVNILRGGLVLGIIGSVLKLFAGANVPLLFITSLIGSVAVLPISFMINLYVIDCMTYGEWKNGKRADGFISVLIQFGNKVGSGFASAGIGFLMGMVGYDGSLAVQSPAVTNMIIALYTWIPAIIFAIDLLLLTMHDLDKRMPQIKQELEARKAAAAAADTAL